MTAGDIVATSLRRINAIAPGENPTAAEAAAGLECLNDMVDSWQIERLMLYAVIRQEFYNPPQQTYTVGPGADIDIPRPVRIDRYGVMLLNNPNQPLELPMQKINEQTWLMIPVKDIPSTVPRCVYDDNGFPWRTLWLWPIPAVMVGVILYYWGSVSQFRDLATNYEFPQGYADALKYNLPLRLAMEFGGFIPPTLPAMAAQAIAKVKSVNHDPARYELRCDDAIITVGRGRYNWLTDTPIASR